MRAVREDQPALLIFCASRHSRAGSETYSSVKPHSPQIRAFIGTRTGLSPRMPLPFW